MHPLKEVYISSKRSERAPPQFAEHIVVAHSAQDGFMQTALKRHCSRAETYQCQYLGWSCGLMRRPTKNRLMTMYAGRAPFATSMFGEMAAMKYASTAQHTQHQICSILPKTLWWTSYPSPRTFIHSSVV